MTVDRPDIDSEVAAPAAAPPSRRPWRLAARIAQLAVLLAVVAYVAGAMARSLREVDWSQVHVSGAYLALGMLAVLVQMVLIATAYRATLRSVARVPSWPVLLGITWLSRLGKYLPGKVFSVAGAAYLLARYGVPGAVATGMVLINTVLAVIVGVVVSAPLLLMHPGIRDRLPQLWLFSAMHIPAAWGYTMAVVLAGALMLHPRVGLALMGKALSRFGKAPVELRPSWADYILPSLHMVGQWIFAGVGLWCLVRGLGIDFEPRQLPLCMSASALAITLGFVVLFAPGGIGVREMVYLAVLSPLMTPGEAAIVTVGTRLMTTGAELLLGLVGAVILRIMPPGAGSCANN